MMKKIFKNKKASTGLIILLFFTFVAIIGPLFTTYDPIEPGSVSPGLMPVAVQSSYPGWYPQVLGGKAYTTHVLVTRDAQFSNPDQLRQWKNSSTAGGISVGYNSETGWTAATRSASKGSVEITFTQEGNATISIPFDYPYDIPPRMYATEWSYRVEAQNQSDQPADITIFTAFSYNTTRGVKRFPASMPQDVRVHGVGLASTGWIPEPWHFASSINAILMGKYGIDPTGIIFAKPRKYSFEITAQFSGNATAAGNPKLLLGNVNLVLFGNSFGLLGTDEVSRDLFTQIIVGTRISFVIGIVSAVLSVGIGLIVGLLAGYIGGAVDEVLMRFNDMLLVIPTLPLLIVLVFVMGQSMVNIIFVVGFLGWMGFARTVRSSVLSLKERQFIEAVKSAGGGRLYIIRRHIIPNVFPLVYITLAMAVPSAIVSEAALSWLGLGPTDVMSWGRILHEFELSGNIATGAFTYWYWTLPPGICIALLSLAFVLIGYALDEILNPKLRDR